MKAHELKALPPKILCYGPAGCGKSALLMTLGEKLELLDFDDNLPLGLDDNLSTERAQVEVTQFLDTPPKISAFGEAKKRVRDIVAQCNKGTYPYEVLGVDSLTSMASASQYQTMANNGGWNTTPQIQHWGMLLNEIENLLKQLRTLPIPVIFIAHEEEFVTEEVSRVRVAIPGQKLPPKIVRMFSEIWYFQLRAVGGGKQEMQIRTAPSQSITCRSGKGLASGLVFGTIGKDGRSASDSVSMWDILDKIQTKETATTPV